MTSTELEESRRRHQEMTALEVSRTLRAYQRAWFERLRQEVFAEGRPYVLTTGVFPHEIFEALDLPFVIDAWYSGLVAARRQSAYYSDYLARVGYHPDLNRYGALALGVMMDEHNPDKPWGGLPRPALVATGWRNLSAPVIAEWAGVPFVGIEQPWPRRLYPNWWEMSRWQWEDLEETDRIDVMVEQFKEVIAHAERLAGRKLDYDRLREIVDRVNQQERYFDEVRTIIATAEKAPVRLGEAMSQTMGIQWHRGTEWALNQARAFRDEIKWRADNQLWVCPNERYRMMYIGSFLSQALDFFAAFEASHG
jgi:hypothetical protein